MAGAIRPGGRKGKIRSVKCDHFSLRRIPLAAACNFARELRVLLQVTDEMTND